MLPCAEPRVLLSRLLNKAVVAALAHPEGGAFEHPVDPEEFPTYAQEVGKPMELSTLQRRVVRQKYGTVAAFKSDLNLVASNCKRFCYSRFPKLPPKAKAVVDQGKRMLEEWEAELEVAEEQVREKEEDDEDDEDRKERLFLEALEAEETAMNADGTGAGAEAEAAEEERKRRRQRQRQRRRQLPVTFTIVVRLGMDSTDFLVQETLYSASVGREWRKNERFRLPMLADPTGPAGAGAASIYASGYVVGISSAATALAKHASSTGGQCGLLPYEALQVEWDDGSMENTYVNPWEVELMKKKPKKAKKKKETKRKKAEIEEKDEEGDAGSPDAETKKKKKRKKDKRKDEKKSKRQRD
jgi:hypothetical protein